MYRSGRTKNGARRANANRNRNRRHNEQQQQHHFGFGVGRSASSVEETLVSTRSGTQRSPTRDLHTPRDRTSARRLSCRCDMAAQNDCLRGRQALARPSFGKMRKTFRRHRHCHRHRHRHIHTFIAFMFGVASSAALAPPKVVRTGSVITILIPYWYR